MKKLFLINIVLIFLAQCIMPQKVKTGIEILRENNFKQLEGMRLGLVTNASGVDSELKSTVDILFEAQNLNLAVLYGPEHGVRGNIEGGQLVDNYTDERTQLPVYSLYGKTRKPTPEMLKDIDAIVYDIQDIGCRSYTFISTMGLVMESAAENGKEVFILDRPNPLGGIRVEGSIVEDEYISFISQFKIPYVYGLTCGELAILLNEEGMLKNGVKCDLTVIEMEGWQRNMTFDQTGLPWILTSPHIPHNYSPFYYVCSGIVGELRDAVSIGVGYTLPFQTFAAEWIDGNFLADKLNSYDIENVLFRPINYIPYYAHGKGNNLGGVQIFITDYNEVDLMPLQFYFLQAVKELYPDLNIFDKALSNQIKAFDKALGSNQIREKFIQSWRYKDIEQLLKADAEKFKQRSSKYYLYN
ncbi:MAG: DUF1343 domain-containing protein [Melioribacteraceae bacterium]|nr:DUF1343 domain-containing protein [Melioribacteraceae bacterium]